MPVTAKGAPVDSSAAIERGEPARGRRRVGRRRAGLERIRPAGPDRGARGSGPAGRRSPAGPEKATTHDRLTDPRMTPTGPAWSEPVRPPIRIQPSRIVIGSLPAADLAAFHAGLLRRAVGNNLNVLSPFV